MRPLSAHDRFFSSLSQVEKRLQSEGGSSSNPVAAVVPPSPLPYRTTHPSSSDPFGSPLYLGIPELPAAAPRPPTHLQDSSGPALEFLSCSQQHPPPSPGPDRRSPVSDDSDDDIERLMGLLGISAEGGGTVAGAGEVESCDCSGGGFYSKIAGVKGPKCGREMRRLDGWIDYYYRGSGGEGRLEPARLAHLLLAKAACSAGEEGDGFDELGFPSTVEEFLDQDPPTTEANVNR